MFARSFANSAFALPFEGQTATRECPATSNGKNTSHLLRPPVSTNFEQKRIAKTVANSKPICGVRYMLRRWRNFAKQKARRRLFSRRMPGGPGGNVRVPFLSPFLCGTTKKGHQMQATSAHEVQCECPVAQAAENAIAIQQPRSYANSSAVTYSNSFSNCSNSSRQSANTLRAFFTVSGLVRSTPAILSSSNGSSLPPVLRKAK